jgi:predicted RNA-binding protein with PIN domain
MPGPHTIVIDGYNLILRSPAFRPDDRRDLAMARDKLVNLLSWTIGGGEARFIVVFDGSETGFGPRRTTRSGGVTVRFSKPPAKADDLIRDLVEELHETQSETTVVTSDLEVARHAQTFGAKIVLSDLFAASLFPERVKEQVERLRSAEDDEASDKPLGFSKKELEEWARIFAEDREEAEES